MENHAGAILRWLGSSGFEGLDGAVWLRTNFNMPQNWVDKDLVLDLNRIRDYDFTYVNGKLVGTHGKYRGKKIYNSKTTVLHAGKNTIAILVLNYFDKGGIAGYKDTTSILEFIPGEVKQANSLLNGQWKYFIQNDEPPRCRRLPGRLSAVW